MSIINFHISFFFQKFDIFVFFLFSFISALFPFFIDLFGLLFYDFITRKRHTEKAQRKKETIIFWTVYNFKMWKLPCNFALLFDSFFVKCFKYLTDKLRQKAWHNLWLIGFQSHPCDRFLYFRCNKKKPLFF